MNDPYIESNNTNLIVDSKTNKVKCPKCKKLTSLHKMYSLMFKTGSEAFKLEDFCYRHLK